MVPSRIHFRWATTGTPAAPFLFPIFRNSRPTASLRTFPLRKRIYQNSPLSLPPAYFYHCGQSPPHFWLMIPAFGCKWWIHSSFFFFFFVCTEVSRPGIKPCHGSDNARSFNCWATRELHSFFYSKKKKKENLISISLWGTQYINRYSSFILNPQCRVQEGRWGLIRTLMAACPRRVMVGSLLPYESAHPPHTGHQAAPAICPLTLGRSAAWEIKDKDQATQDNGMIMKPNYLPLSEMCWKLGEDKTRKKVMWLLLGEFHLENFAHRKGRINVL